MPPISVQIRKGDALGYELMSEVVEVSRPSRFAASASSVTRACALFATHRTQTRSRTKGDGVSPNRFVRSFTYLGRIYGRTVRVPAHRGRGKFSVLSALQERTISSRGAFFESAQSFLQRVYALSGLRIGPGSTAPVKRGDFGEGQAIAGERIWNIT
jgi:hypothetical protein